MSTYSEEGSEAAVDEDLQRDLDSLRKVLEEEEPAALTENEPSTSLAERPLEGLKLCLQKNHENQILLKHLLKKIDEALVINRNKIYILSQPPMYSKRARVTFWKFYIGSYFKDHKNRNCPSLLMDVTQPLPDGPRNFYVKDNTWRKDKEDVKLFEGVRIQAIDKRSFPLQARLEKATTNEERRSIRSQIFQLSKLSDDELLSDLTEIDWSSINYAQFNSRKTAVDCRLRWENFVSPKVYNGLWSKEEEKRLVRLAKEYNSLHWQDVAREIGTNRTAFACLKHYTELFSKSSIQKQVWTPETDQLLRTGVAKFGEKNWRAVAEFVGNGYSHSQCLHRWFNSTKPTIKKGRWSDEEDELLKEAVKVHGTKWSLVALMVPSRTSTQCRERWVNVLDTNLNKGPWDKEEDQKLINICRRYKGGSIPWAKVALEMGNRTDAMCSFRWRSLSSTPDIVNQFASRVAEKALTKNAHISASDIEVGMLPQAYHQQVESYRERLVNFKTKRRVENATCPSPEMVIKACGMLMLDSTSPASQLASSVTVASPLLTNTQSAPALSTASSSGSVKGNKNSGTGGRGGSQNQSKKGRRRKRVADSAPNKEQPAEKRRAYETRSSVQNTTSVSSFSAESPCPDYDMMRLTDQLMQERCMELLSNSVPGMTPQQMAADFIPTSLSAMGIPIFIGRGEAPAGQSPLQLTPSQLSALVLVQHLSQGSSLLPQLVSLPQTSAVASQIAQLPSVLQAQLSSQANVSLSASSEAQVLAQSQRLAQQSGGTESSSQAHLSPQTESQGLTVSQSGSQLEGQVRPMTCSSSWSEIHQSAILATREVQVSRDNRISISSGMPSQLLSQFPKGPKFITYVRTHGARSSCATHQVNTMCSLCSSSSIASSFVQPHASLLAPRCRQTSRSETDRHMNTSSSSSAVNSRNNESTHENRLELERDFASGEESESNFGSGMEMDYNSVSVLESGSAHGHERELIQSPSQSSVSSSPLNPNHPVGAAVSALLSLSDHTNSRSPSKYPSSPLVRVSSSSQDQTSPVQVHSREMEAAGASDKDEVSASFDSTTSSLQTGEIITTPAIYSSSSSSRSLGGAATSCRVEDLTAHSAPLVDKEAGIETLIVPEAISCTECLSEESDTMRLTRESSIALVKVDGVSLIDIPDNDDEEIPCLVGFSREASVESSCSSLIVGSWCGRSSRSPRTPSSLSDQPYSPSVESQTSTSASPDPEIIPTSQHCNNFAVLLVAGEPEVCGLPSPEMITSYINSQVTPTDLGCVQGEGPRKRQRLPPRKARSKWSTNTAAQRTATMATHPRRSTRSTAASSK